MVIAWIIYKDYQSKRGTGKFEDRYINLLFGLISYAILPFRYPGISLGRKVILSILATFAAWFASRFFNWFTKKENKKLDKTP
jgi:hypothetical protein